MSAHQRDSRRVLLDAAAKEFAKHGARGARVETIVKSARVNERMIYHHFGSKDGLYQAVLADQWQGLGATLQRSLPAATELAPREGLELVFTGLVAAFAERPLLIPLVLHEAMNGWQSVPQITLAKVPREIRALYSRGQRDGVFRDDCEFETLYLTALGAIVSLRVLAPRFTDLRESHAAPAALAAAAKRMIDLVLDGASQPDAKAARPRRVK